MSKIQVALDAVRERTSEARSTSPFRLVSTLEPAASREEIEAAWKQDRPPHEIIEFWSACRSARLFEDVEYGQWGLVLLDPATSAARTASERRERPVDFGRGDVVIGQFLGDLDLLVLAPTESNDRRMLVALPLDAREDWPSVASDLASFIRRSSESAGEKYWER